MTKHDVKFACRHLTGVQHLVHSDETTNCGSYSILDRRITTVGHFMASSTAACSSAAVRALHHLVDLYQRQRGSRADDAIPKAQLTAS